MRSEILRRLQRQLTFPSGENAPRSDDSENQQVASPSIRRSASVPALRPSRADTSTSFLDHNEEKDRRTTSDSHLYKLLRIPSQDAASLRSMQERDKKNTPFQLPYESNTPILFLMESLRDEIWKSDDATRRKAAFMKVLDSAMEALEDD